MRDVLNFLERMAPGLGGISFGLLIAHIFFGASSAAGNIGMAMAMLVLISAVTALPRFKKSAGKQNV